jgi:hypothetical protein
MICKGCAEAGNFNRDKHYWAQKEPVRIPVYLEHPTDCGCACMHKMPGQWEKQFSVKPPWLKETEEV